MNRWPAWRAKFILLLFRPTLWWNRFLQQVAGRHWWDWVDDHILLGAMPFEAELEQLQKLDICAVINMCAEFPGRKDALQKHGIEQLWLPTPDFTPPSVEDIRRGVDFLKEAVQDGKKVYVHCKAGRGRSATIVLCYLASTQGITAEAAQQHLQKVRPHVNRGLAQRAVVRQFLQEAGETPDRRG